MEQSWHVSGVMETRPSANDIGVGSLEALRLRPRPEQSEPFCALIDGASDAVPEIRFGASWTSEGITGQNLAWNCGYGPETEALLLRPSGREPVASVLLMHDHAGFKWWGKERFASGPQPAPAELERFIGSAYEGRRFADELARAGYLVLVHDVFLWGSRKLLDSEISEWDQRMGKLLAEANGEGSNPIAIYNAQAHFAEATTQKVLMTRGLDLASVVHFEDGIALQVLQRLGEGRSLAVVGHSGGGVRAAMIKSRQSSVQAFAIAGMMSADAALSVDNICGHTWMLFASRSGWLSDWPETVLRETRSDLFVIHYADDELFSPQGMRESDVVLEKAYAAGPGRYRSELLPGPHRFGIRAQDSVLDWLASVFSPPRHHS